MRLRQKIPRQKKAEIQQLWCVYFFLLFFLLFLSGWSLVLQLDHLLQRAGGAVDGLAQH